MELISIIVPVYNVENYLRKCLDSICNQTYKNLEIILVDDGSPDNCGTICDEYAEKDKRVKVVHKKNGGASSARNEGLDIATGEYIGFVDSDDYIELDMYECLHEAIKRNTASIACCGRKIVNLDDQVMYENFTFKEEILYSNNAINELLIGKDFDEAMWDKLYPSYLFENVRFPVGEVNEDICVLLEIFSKISVFVHVGKCLYNYRVNPVGVTKSSYSSKMHCVISHIEQAYEFLDNVNSKYIDCLACRYSFNMLRSIYSTNEYKTIFNDDYVAHKNILKRTWKNSLKYGKLSLKEKIKIVIMRFNFWKVLLLFKR